MGLGLGLRINVKTNRACWLPGWRHVQAERRGDTTSLVVLVVLVVVVVVVGAAGRAVAGSSKALSVAELSDY